MINIIIWLVLGALAGWIASKIMGTDAQQGAVLNIIVGILGAMIGGWILSFFGVNVMAGFNILSILTAVLGACILIFIVKLVTGRRV